VIFSNQLIHHKHHKFAVLKIVLVHMYVNHTLMMYVMMKQMMKVIVVVEDNFVENLFV
jgi:hypothetical protein